MIVSGFKLKYKIQAEIKATAVMECSNWNPWNVLMRMHRRRIKAGDYIYTYWWIDGLMDGMVEGATNMDMRYWYL